MCVYLSECCRPSKRLRRVNSTGSTSLLRRIKSTGKASLRRISFTWWRKRFQITTHPLLRHAAFANYFRNMHIMFWQLHSDLLLKHVNLHLGIKCKYSMTPKRYDVHNFTNTLFLFCSTLLQPG